MRSMVRSKVQPGLMRAYYAGMSIPLYDDHGNIQSLTRNGKVDGAKTQIDNLTYTYASNGDQLTSVEDASAGSRFGYPNSTTGIATELQYDKNGNLTSDLNSQITSVTYNYLNLPDNITIDLPGTSDDYAIAYTYDATGYILRKSLTKGGSVVRTIDYDHGIQYFNGALSIIYTSEGRVTPYNGAYEYEYFIKDHLTNTRIVFGNVHETSVYKATMETPLATTEEQRFRNISTCDAFPQCNHTASTPLTSAPAQSAIVNGYNNGSSIGPAKMLQVKSGDHVSLEVFARYTTAVSSDAAIGNLGIAVANAFGVINSGEAQQAYQAIVSGVQ